MSKLRKSFRLSGEADRLLKLMSDKMGISEAAILEMAIREKAVQMSIQPRQSSTNPPPPTRQS